MSFWLYCFPALLFVPGNCFGIQLSPQSATGGELIDLADGTKAITHSNDIGSPLMYSWPLPTPLTNGWWHLKFTVAATANRDLANGFRFDGSPNIRLNTPDLTTSTIKATQHELWYYAQSPVTSLQVFRNSSPTPNGLKTLPVIAIDIDDAPSPPPRDIDVRIMAELRKLVGKGPIQVPAEFPSGTAILAIQNFGADYPTTITWKEEDDATGSFMPKIRFPPFGDFFDTLYFSKRFKSMTVTSPVPYPHLPYVWMHHPPALTLDNYDSGHAPILARTTGQGFEVVEEFHFFTPLGLAPEPEIPLFPDGSPMAMVLSFDDGPSTDLALAKALKQIQARATFFLVRTTPAMGFANQLESLGMDIGAHTLQHPRLSRCSPDQAYEECARIRESLESRLGHPIITFAYPYGDDEAQDTMGNFVERSVVASEYMAARSTAETPLNINGTYDSLRMPVSKLLLPNADFENSLSNTWKQVEQSPPGGIVHWWGHSWQFTDTKRLTNALAPYVNKTNVWHATFGDLALWQWVRANATLNVRHPNPGETIARIAYPALHPFLSRLPISLTIPDGVTNITVRGESLRLAGGIVSVTPQPPVALAAPEFFSILEVSTNLSEWISIATNRIASETLTTVLGNVPANAFYRQRWIRQSPLRREAQNPNWIHARGMDSSAK